MKLGPRRVSNLLYREMHRSFPIVCVDIVVTDARGSSFLLVKRAQDPEKGAWWFPGGRIMKNERLVDAARRKAKEEIGLDGRVVRMLGVYEYLRPRGYFTGVSAHTIPLVFLVRVAHRGKVSLDTTSSHAAWFREIAKGWDPYIKDFLRRAGF